MKKRWIINFTLPTALLVIIFRLDITIAFALLGVVTTVALIISIPILLASSKELAGMSYEPT